jgi:endonuclease
MPIYDKPVRVRMREMAAELAPKPGDVMTKHNVLSWFREHYPKIKEGTVLAHHERLATIAEQFQQMQADLTREKRR